eukprot:1156174-Pelagomonas_calceolata.AAC.7
MPSYRNATGDFTVTSFVLRNCNKHTSLWPPLLPLFWMDGVAELPAWLFAFESREWRRFCMQVWHVLIKGFLKVQKVVALLHAGLAPTRCSASKAAGDKASSGAVQEGLLPGQKGQQGREEGAQRGQGQRTHRKGQDAPDLHAGCSRCVCMCVCVRAPRPGNIQQRRQCLRMLGTFFEVNLKSGMRLLRERKRAWAVESSPTLYNVDMEALWLGSSMKCGMLQLLCSPLVLAQDGINAALKTSIF